MLKENKTFQKKGAFIFRKHPIISTYGNKDYYWDCV